MASADIDEKELRSAAQGILAGADLTQLSSKQIRKQLEAKFKTDLTARKKEIDHLVLELIAEKEKEQEEEVAESDGKKDGDKDSSDQQDSDSDGPEDMSPPVKKKKKNQKSSTQSSDDLDSDPEKVTDEQLAMYLQEAEQVGRRTRGNRKTPMKKPTSKKSSSDGSKKKTNSNSTYAKECVLSPALSLVMGVEKMKRSDVVKRMWEVVKERGLQDPKNKSFMICDDELYRIFGRKRVKAFGMMKYLTDHIFTPEQYDECFGTS